MNARSDNLEHSHSRQLAEFAEQLQKEIADESLLDDIHHAIQEMLWENESVGADIRRILREQHKAGTLRDETFELVEGMLDRMLTEGLDTAPTGPRTPDTPEEAPQSNPPFTDTTVIEKVTIDEDDTGDRLQIGSVLRDRFLLQKKIAGGSMGVVYKAMDRRLAEAEGVDPSVAIKVLAPALSRNASALRALQQEAAKGRCLSHPNIVRFIDLDRDDDLYFIVMEWLHGKSLASILDDSKSSRTIDKVTALDIVKQVAKALDYAHLRGVVHADVKPGNIMVSPDGVVKLFDFGIARVRQKQFDGHEEFDPGVLGAVTPAYSSMQVLTGEEPVASDDVFSLACLAYRLIAGYRVFGPRNAAEAAEAGMEPQRPQGLKDAEWHALRKALSYSRVSRFASPAEFIGAMTTPVAIRATRVAEELDEPNDDRRRQWPYLVIAAALVVSVIGLDRFGMLDELFRLREPGANVTDDQHTIGEQTPTVEAPIEIDQLAEEPLGDKQGNLFDEGLLIDETAGGEEQAGDLMPQAELIDFSTLPPATVEIPLAFPGTARTEVDLTLREDEEPAIVDLVRGANFSAESLLVRLEEVSFSGNRSPWESGQYHISGGSMVRFMRGQDRARFTVTMTPDPLREPDRQVSLLVRDDDNAASEYAVINLTLEDDDQRRFEAGLGPNTVAFAVGQVSVRERDPAVQIDIIRFNPDQTALSVDYVLRDVTATEGEDYFAPGAKSVQFGPGQRSARILIPLVQDSSPESDEAFMLELPEGDAGVSDANIFRRITVMIRDDDSHTE